MEADVWVFLHLYTKKKQKTPMVNKYTLQVKWGHKKDFGPICLRPDVRADWHCVASVCGWKVPALSIVRYINGGCSHNPSRAAGEPLQLSEGCSICAGLLEKPPATVNTCLRASRCHFLRTGGNLSESRGQWESVHSGAWDTYRDVALVSALLCASVRPSQMLWNFTVHIDDRQYTH